MRPGLSLRRVPLLPGLGLVLLALFGTLYLLAPQAYFRILGGWGFGPYRTPFFDAEGLSAQIRCFRQGIDSYTVNPCDPLNRLFDYSPLWLHMPFMALDHRGAVWLGFVQALGFIGSLAVLPRPRTRGGWLFMVLAVASPASLFAVERSNADVPIFCAVALSIWLLQRGFAARVGGYGVIMAVALLKFYPLVLLAQFLRETRGRAAALVLAAGAILAGFAAIFGHDTRRALRNMPHPQPFGDSFGATQLGQAVAIWGQAPLVAVGCVALLGLVSLILAIRLARGGELAAAMARLTPAELGGLLAGALLVEGCFISGVNIGYRAVFLLFAMPGLVALSADAGAGLVGAAQLLGAPASVLLLWSLVPLALAKQAPLALALPLGAAGLFVALTQRGARRLPRGLAVLCLGWLLAAMAAGLGATLVTGLPGSTLFNLACITRDLVWWGVATLLLAVSCCGVFALPRAQPLERPPRGRLQPPADQGRGQHDNDGAPHQFMRDPIDIDQR